MERLQHFLAQGKTQFHVVSLAKSYLHTHGFLELTGKDDLSVLPAGKYYLSPFSSVIIPFVKGDSIRRVRIAAAHTDFPMLKVKPNPDIRKHGYLQLNVEPYGGLIKETWFDRPLGIAGKIVCRSAEIFRPEVRLFDSETPVGIIPNLAPHLKRGAKETELDVQKELIPIIDMQHADVAEKDSDSAWLSYLAGKLDVSPDDILDYDLYLYICGEPTALGLQQDLLCSPRIDNISSVCAILEALTHAEPGDTLMLGALFDNEEIGSRSKQGADSTLLTDVLRCLTQQTALSLSEDGFYLSVDVAHATHPNYSEKSDITNPVVLGRGVAIKTSAGQRYVSDSEAGACVLELCKRHGISIQKTVNRSGMPGGQTLGPILSSYLPMRACDIGIPVLAMHSAGELMHRSDYNALCTLLSEFFNNCR